MITDTDWQTLVERLGAQERESGDTPGEAVADWAEAWSAQHFDPDAFAHLAGWLGQCAVSDLLSPLAEQLGDSGAIPVPGEFVAANVAAGIRALALGFELGRQSARSDAALSGLDFDADVSEGS